MGSAGITGSWASKYELGQIHIPDKTGTGDTGADQTAGGKEVVSANLPTPSPTHLKLTASASGLEGNFLPRIPAPLEDTDMIKLTFLKIWAEKARTSFPN